MTLFAPHIRKSWLILSVILVLVLIFPILIITKGIFTPGDELWFHLSEHLLSGYIINTLILMIGLASISLVFGLSSAWLVAKYKFFGSKFFAWSLMLPLAIPSYIAAYSYAGLFSFTGPFQILFRLYYDESTASLLFFDIKRMEFLIIILASVMYPYVFISAKSAFLNQSSVYIHSAQSLGASPIKVFFKVALPIARPAIIAGLLLVIMETLNDYGAVHYFGISTFTVGIFRAWFGMNSLEIAMKLSGYFIILIVALLFIERFSRRSARYTESKHFVKAEPLKLSPVKSFFAFIVCFIIFGIGFLIPFSYLAYNSLSFIELALEPKFIAILINSITSALIATLSILLISLLILYSNRLNRFRLSEYLTQLSTLGYSVPGAVISIGIIVAITQVIHSDFINNISFSILPSIIFTGSYLALIIAYIIRYLAVSYNPIQAGFEKIGKHYEEQSLSLGSSPFRTLIRADIPALKNYLAAAAILVFVDLLKELPITLILRPFNFDTLATYTYQLAGDELIRQSSLPAVFIILAGLIPILLLNKIIKS